VKPATPDKPGLKLDEEKGTEVQCRNLSRVDPRGRERVQTVSQSGGSVQRISGISNRANVFQVNFKYPFMALP